MQSSLKQMPAASYIALSIVLPFFRKLEEFRRVLPINHPYFARDEIEVVIALDENSEEHGLLELLRQYPDVRWKVLVNDVPHAWRPPCRAINVGIRHAAGSHVLICSPESAFVGDVPAQMLKIVHKHPDSIALGRVGFAGFDQLSGNRSLEEIYDAAVPLELKFRTFYGSVCGPKAAFEAVRGYDEEFRKWGGDDDNLRVRMEMAGFRLMAFPEARLLHLDSEVRTGREQYDDKIDILKCSPHQAKANLAWEWGRDFSRLAFANVPVAGSQAVVAAELPYSPVALAVRSRRRCRACGRLLYHNSQAVACNACRPAAEGGPQAGAASAHRQLARRPRIACVLQLRNESRYLEGCLAHLRDHVDGFVALDDGSTDSTPEILRREARLLDCITKPDQEGHVWNERENKRVLLQRARELGFDWVLCCDADERYETAFLKRLHEIAGRFPAGSDACFYLALRELWDTPQQYRVDGIWGEKARARFFSLPDIVEFGQDQELHGEWFPDHIRRQGRMLRIDHRLYHLKTILREDRIRRRDYYKALDPGNKFQAMGYDYLAEEGNDLRLEKIAPGREYDFDTLPETLRALLS